MTFRQAFDSFMNDYEQFKAACDMATRQSWCGSSTAMLELFDDGSFRVVPQVGNLYRSPGFLIGIPVLGDEEWDEDPSIRFYDTCDDYLRDAFDEAIEDARCE